MRYVLNILRAWCISFLALGPAQADWLVNPYQFTTSSTQTLSEIITELGLTSNLVLALDAADPDSYPGTLSTLLHFDGSDASTTFTDSSAAAHTWTASGDAQLDTAQNKFGTASGLFDGTGDYISTGDNAAFELGSGDFSIECWVRFNSVGDSVFAAKFVTTGNQRSWGLYYTSNTIEFIYSTDGTSTATVNAAWTPTTNTWYHVAMSRESGTARFFIDGTQVGTDQSLSATFFNGTGATSVGAAAAGTLFPMDGGIDELRIAKYAYRTRNFTAPINPSVNESKWGDLTSGRYDFFRGANGTSSTDDPTFNGTPGDLSASTYWSFDGGDFFQYDTTNETWMENLHKDNATFTAVALVYANGDFSFFGDNDNSFATVGIRFKAPAGSSYPLSVQVTNGSTESYISGGELTLAQTAWACIGVSYNEATPQRYTSSDGTITTDGSIAYSSPSASAATYAFLLGSQGNGNALIASGGRWIAFAMWDTDLTANDMNNVCSLLKARL